ncbi:hypothetical protein KGF57_004649 [Candida theae]|uniref:RRM domain-containing protein n=1 Tax=Candida theae TaxID=1198502 RepID=A0AAD5FWU2_9ASCO|nr:uncharacterized protein KGF57_004649 [Candida theae]KAI5949439.1 hypothetical protein KGF57_004649 [Candida theae]
MSVEPKQTVYVNNINDRVSTNKVRSVLETNLQKYRPVSISLAKTLKLKGQAFLTFQSIGDASRAIEALNNQEYFGKRVRATFANSNSDTLLDKKELKQIRTRRQQEHKVSKQSTKHAKSTVDKSKIKKQNQKLPPHRILLLQNISPALHVTKESLDEFFEKFAGFEAARFIKVRSLAFIDFENDDSAIECLQSIDEDEIRRNFGEDIVLWYAKK